MGEINEKEKLAIQEVQTLSLENAAMMKEEQQRQDKLLKGLKTKDQIQKETEERLKAASSSKGVSVAAALVSSIPVAKEKPARPTIIRRFEVTLYEEDEDEHTGQIIRKIVNGGKPEIIEATSKADLDQKLQLYAMCGQKPVVKEIGQPKIIENGKVISNEEFKQRMYGEEASSHVALPKKEEKKLPPKIYKIGGIEIKNDNGKIFQKQWMQLSENEAKNIRVVNDKTNGIVSLKGKHIEMMKWVLVENSEDDEVSSLEESIK